MSQPPDDPIPAPGEDLFPIPEPEPTAVTNPIQTPLLKLGTCSEADLPLYENYYETKYRRVPIVDKFGRPVTFPPNRTEHLCTSRPKGTKGKNAPRSVWRDDRAQRLPWIEVALTHGSTQIKESKEPGRWAYLIAMLADEGVGLVRNYYQVIVEPRKEGREVVFITAYDKLTVEEWADATRRKSIPPPTGARGSGSGRY